MAWLYSNKKKIAAKQNKRAAGKKNKNMGVYFLRRFLQQVTRKKNIHTSSLFLFLDDSLFMLFFVFIFISLAIKFCFLDSRFQNLETTHEIGVDGHDGSRVVEFTTVVWGGEEGDQLTLREELVAVLNNLVPTAN